MAISEGSKVICIDDKVKEELLGETLACFKHWVKKGIVYTIREICDNDGIVEGYLLEEIVNPKIEMKGLGEKYDGYMFEPRFATWRFAEQETNQLEEEVSLVEELEIAEMEVHGGEAYEEMRKKLN